MMTVVRAPPSPANKAEAPGGRGSSRASGRGGSWDAQPGAPRSGFPSAGEGLTAPSKNSICISMALIAAQ